VSGIFSLIGIACAIATAAAKTYRAAEIAIEFDAEKSAAAVLNGSDVVNASGDDPPTLT
jgi:hypothetical protein